MISAAQLKSELEHIRLIHFSAIVVSIALLSFCWSTQYESNLSSQLTSFEQALNLLNSGQVRKSLEILSPEAAQYAEEQARASFQNAIETRLRWHVPFNGSDTDPRLSVFVMDPGPVDLTASLESIRAQLEGSSSASTVAGDGPWKVRIINEAKPVGESLSSWTQGKIKVIHKNRAAVEGPQVNSVEFEGLGSSTTGRVRIHVKLFQIKKPVPVVESAALFVYDYANYFDFDFSSKDLSTPLLPGWLGSNHPLLVDNWDELKTRNLGEAKQWVRQKAREAVKDRKVEVLGLKIDGYQIAIIGPAILVFMLMYLCAYLVYLHERAKALGLAKDFFLSPWIGGIARPWAFLMTFVTLGLLPATATLLMLWGVLEQRAVATALSCAVALGVGCLLWHVAYPLARLMEDSTPASFTEGAAPAAFTPPPVAISTQAFKEVSKKKRRA